MNTSISSRCEACGKARSRNSSSSSSAANQGGGGKGKGCAKGTAVEWAPVSFGLHKGKTLPEILTADPSWVRDNTDQLLISQHSRRDLLLLQKTTALECFKAHKASITGRGEGVGAGHGEAANVPIRGWMLALESRRRERATVAAPETGFLGSAFSSGRHPLSVARERRSRGWQCPRCTFRNMGPRGSCQMCEYVRRDRTTFP